MAREAKCSSCKGSGRRVEPRHVGIYIEDRMGSCSACDGTGVVLLCPTCDRYATSDSGPCDACSDRESTRST